jgi:isocitrate dehydrogenase
VKRTPITVAYGDGIGPEIMRATLRVLEAAGAALEIETIEIGEQQYLRGHSSGIPPEAWESLRRTRVFLKAPITTPLGGGYKSLNVTIRKTLGLFANVRPTVAYAPYIPTLHPQMDLVIVRENEEDLYGGIEHRQTEEVVQCLKLITRPGSERVIRYAFEYARLYGRKKVTAMTKDNIMKLTDGLFHKVFEEVAAEYPDLEHEHLIIDIGSARLADTPEIFDVIVTPNLYGDILSDIAAQIAGSVGMGGSANIGEQAAMFEAIHGSAPPLAGKDLANPSGLLQAAVMMLVHIGQPEVAERIQNAWLRTLEEGLHTIDIYREGHSRARLGTQAFADAVIERLGQHPEHLKPVSIQAQTPLKITLPTRHPARKELTGVDVFLAWSEDGRNPERLAQRLKALEPPSLQLNMITNRGTKVWPGGFPETFCTDHWRCRFQGEHPQPQDILELLRRISEAGLEFIKTENLYTFDGVPGFSLGQGQ